jgi:hypothetical protein
MTRRWNGLQQDLSSVTAVFLGLHIMTLSRDHLWQIDVVFHALENWGRSIISLFLGFISV